MTGPEVSQHVELLVGDGEPVGARVESVDGESLTLVPVGKAPAAGRAKLHFTNKRGVCSVDGVVGGGPGTSVTFQRDGRPRLIQRREHVRVAATVPVTYSPDGNRREESYTLDVSGGGFVLGSAAGLDVGGMTHFTLHLDDEPLETFGTAVRRTDRGGVAINIDVIAPGARERLIHWIFRRERLTRAYARGR
jgi:hypothetical protein